MNPCPMPPPRPRSAPPARELPLPAIRDQAARLAEIAAREHATHLAYLAEILAAEPIRA
jgi:hypothetical protein